MSQFQLDPASGSAFGLAIKTRGDAVKLAAVNDDTNKLEVFNLDNPQG